MNSRRTCDPLTLLRVKLYSSFPTLYISGRDGVAVCWSSLKSRGSKKESSFFKLGV